MALHKHCRDTYCLDLLGVDAAALVDVEELVQIVLDLLDLARAHVAVVIKVCKQTLYSPSA